MTSQLGKQTIAINILGYQEDTRSKYNHNQAMKFGQLIDYKISIEKSYTKYGGETSTRPFSKKSKLSISLNQQSKVL